MPTILPKKKRLIFGFYSVPDLLTTLFLPSFSLQSVAAVLVWISTLAGIIYPDKTVVLLLFLLMLFDWITGVYKAYKRGTFNSFTFQRMILNIFATNALICAATWLTHTMWLFSFLKIHEVLMTGFLITYFVSVIENFHSIDERIIPTKLYTFITNVLNLDTVLKNIISRNATSTPIEAIEATATPPTDTPTE